MFRKTQGEKEIEVPQQARTAGRQKGRAQCERLCEPAGGSVGSADDHTLGIVMTGVHSLASTNFKQNILSNIKKGVERREGRRGKRRRKNGRQGEEKRRGKKERRKE